MPKIALKKNERVLSELRRHGITYMWSWTAIMVLFCIPFFFMFWLFNHGWWGQTLFVVPVTVGALWLLRTIFVTYKNVTILTTHRVIDIDQRGFFDKRVSDVSYEQIEDVSGHVKGVAGTLFRYGNVHVETGSRNTEIVIDRVKRPTQIQQMINEYRDTYVSTYAHEFSDNVADVIIEKLHELEEPELLRVKKALRKHLEKRKAI